MRSLPAIIIIAVHEHRRRTAQLVGGLDDLRRSVVDAESAGVAETAGVSAPAVDHMPDRQAARDAPEQRTGGLIDAATLLAHFSEHLQAGDTRLGRLVRELEAQWGHRIPEPAARR